MDHHRILEFTRIVPEFHALADLLLQKDRIDLAFPGEGCKLVSAPAAVDGSRVHETPDASRDAEQNLIRGLSSIDVIDDLEIRDVGEDHDIFLVRLLLHLPVHLLDERLPVDHARQGVVRLPVDALPLLSLHLCIVANPEKCAEVIPSPVFHPMAGDNIVLPVFPLPELDLVPEIMRHPHAVLDEFPAGDRLSQQLRARCEVVFVNPEQGVRHPVGVDRTTVRVEEEDRVAHFRDKEIIKSRFQEDRPVFDGKEINEDASHRESDHGPVNRPVKQGTVVFPQSDNHDAQQEHQIALQIQRRAGEDLPDK